MVLLLVGASLFLVFLPVPFGQMSTPCEHALSGCALVMGGYGSVTYDLFGYGGFLGPTNQFNVYSLFL